MSLWRIVFGLIALSLIVLAAYVRLAPADPARWHLSAYPAPPGDYPFQGGFQAVRALDRPGPAVLADIDRVIRATPRTRVLAGSLEEGMVTYVTRSAFWGFPDYTTVWLETDGNLSTIRLYGRSRFGASDLGVNEARIRSWLSNLGLRP